jgi:hypothetical protein
MIIDKMTLGKGTDLLMTKMIIDKKNFRLNDRIQNVRLPMKCLNSWKSKHIKSVQKSLRLLKVSRKKENI